MENEPQFKLHGSEGQEWIIDGNNSALFRHLGANAIYDNITAQLEVNPPLHTRIFRHQEGYDQLESFMLENGFPVHLNLRAVGAMAIKSFEASIRAQTEDIDSFPEEWNEQGDKD